MGWLGSIVPLNHLGHYIHWHFILISVSNLIVICLMVGSFVAALFLPFPGRSRRKESQ